jgi:hypothetical protein
LTLIIGEGGAEGSFVVGARAGGLAGGFPVGAAGGLAGGFPVGAGGSFVGAGSSLVGAEVGSPVRDGAGSSLVGAKVAKVGSSVGAWGGYGCTGGFSGKVEVDQCCAGGKETRTRSSLGKETEGGTGGSLGKQC